MNQKPKHLRDILKDALAELGKLEHFTEDDIEAMWRKVQKEI
jgi:ribosome recycling factor